MSYRGRLGAHSTALGNRASERVLEKLDFTRSSTDKNEADGNLIVRGLQRGQVTHHLRGCATTAFLCLTSVAINRRFEPKISEETTIIFFAWNSQTNFQPVKRPFCTEII